MSRLSHIYWETESVNLGQACDLAILKLATLLVKSHGHVGREFKLRPLSAGSILTSRNRIEPFRFRIEIGAPANINARISHLAESETASLKNAHAAAGAAAGRQRAAKASLTPFS
jgi:hypothetical protein